MLPSAMLFTSATLRPETSEWVGVLLTYKRIRVIVYREASRLSYNRLCRSPYAAMTSAWRGVMTLLDDVMDRSNGVTWRPRWWPTTDCRSRAPPSLRRSSKFQVTLSAVELNVAVTHELLNVICVLCISSVSPGSGLTSSFSCWPVVSSCTLRLSSLLNVVGVPPSTSSTTSTSISADCGLLTSSSRGSRS